MRHVDAASGVWAGTGIALASRNFQHHALELCMCLACRCTQTLERVKFMVMSIAAELSCFLSIVMRDIVVAILGARD